MFLLNNSEWEKRLNDISYGETHIYILCKFIEEFLFSLNSPLGRCNCADYTAGELTGGWYCPLHGQQF